MARWRRGDTEAFNAVMSAGDKARAMYEKYQAGQAFKDASQVTEAGQVQSAASRAEADALSAQDAQTFGISPEEQASGQYAQRAAIADASNKQYGLGKNPTSFRSTAYTPEEQAAAGYRGQQTYYAASGDTEKALDLGLKSKAIEAAALQQELTKGQLAMQPGQLALQSQTVAEGVRKSETQRREDAVREQWKNPTEKLLDQFNRDAGRFGEGNNAGKRANAVPLPNGSGDYLVWQVNADGKVVGDSKVMPKAELDKEAQHSMLADLAQVNPEKYLGAALLSGHSRDQLVATIKHNDQTYAHQVRTADIADKKATALIDAQKQHSAEALKRLDILGREKPGTPIKMLDADGNSVLAVPIVGKDGNFTFKKVDTGGLSFAPNKELRDYPDSVMKVFAEKYMDATPAQQLTMRMANPGLAAATGFGEVKTTAPKLDAKGKPIAQSQAAQATGKPLGSAQGVPDVNNQAIEGLTSARQELGQRIAAAMASGDKDTAVSLNNDMIMLGQKIQELSSSNGVVQRY